MKKLGQHPDRERERTGAEENHWAEILACRLLNETKPGKAGEPGIAESEKKNPKGLRRCAAANAFPQHCTGADPFDAIRRRCLAQESPISRPVSRPEYFIPGGRHHKQKIPTFK